jgi:ubiquinone/menaquinone biosynthesis C-methylase UbiE
VNTLNSKSLEKTRRSDSLFWEQTYQKTPDLYEELIRGEKLAPEIFQTLAPYLKNESVLDAGAGSGRASLECLRFEVKKLYAVDPSPGLLNLLERKLIRKSVAKQIVVSQGCFDRLPLKDNSVSVSLACSAFTSEPRQGGEQGLAELKRVTKPGGRIVIIWPRSKDHEWFLNHGFCYVKFTLKKPMNIQFRSLQETLFCAQYFYPKNENLFYSLQNSGKPEISFSALGLNPPNDFFWKVIEK